MTDDLVKSFSKIGFGAKVKTLSPTTPYQCLHFFTPWCKIALQLLNFEPPLLFPSGQLVAGECDPSPLSFLALSFLSPTVIVILALSFFLLTVMPS